MKWRLLPNDPAQSWLRYAWLIYALPFFATAFAPGLSLGQRLAIWGACPVFLVLYFSGYWMRDRRIYAIVVCLAAMAVLYATITPVAAVFFIYGAAFLGSCRPRVEAIIALLVQASIAVVAGLLLNFDLWYFIPAVIIALFIGAVTMHGREQAIANSRLRLARSEVERLAQLAERERIARDLHDLLGHTLSVITLKSELAGKLMTANPEQAAREVADVEQIAREGLAQVRAAITGYRSSGLNAEIEATRETLRTADIATEVDIQLVPLGPAEETAIALALREATTNVIRHADAKSCRIRLYAREGTALLEIEDDGRGTDRPFGNGLTGMRERLTALGGALSREWARAQEPRGTRLVISLPLRAIV
ncbi:MAG: sensor histidine kinase [Cytophagaceae bacterium]|nr:sensor histidine kinase [Gemmatimonadaceae bacterium]